MKKMVIVAAVVCATAFAKAASVDWSATATSSYNGQDMYLLTTINESYDSLEDFTKTAVGVGTVGRSGPSYKVSKVTSTNDSITDKANFYLAVFDANDDTVVHYMDVSSGMQGLVYQAPNPPGGTFSVAFADVAGSAKIAKIGSVTPPGPTPAMPEPTSGLLLLVGGAALALRRRR